MIELAEMLLCGVIDGKSMGHYCCGVFHCHEPLPNQTKRKFCEKHVEAESLCAGTGVKGSHGCTERAKIGHKTCASHRRTEDDRKIRGEERFKARRREEKRAKKHNHRQYADDTGYRRGSEAGDYYEAENNNTEEDDAESEADAAQSESESGMATDDARAAKGPALSQGLSPDPSLSVRPSEPACSSKGKISPPLTGRWTRRRTHNEQVFVRPCGVITFRETLYDSEGPRAVYVSRIMACVVASSNLGLQVFIRRPS